MSAIEKQLVEQLVRQAVSMAGQMEPDREAGDSHILAASIALLGAAMIRLCKRHSGDAAAALDIAIEGLQGARRLLSRRGPRS